MREPFEILGNTICTDASVGIAICNSRDENAERLLSYADIALYHAKNDVRGSYKLFTEEMEVGVRERVTLNAELRQALERGSSSSSISRKSKSRVAASRASRHSFGGVTRSAECSTRQSSFPPPSKAVCWCRSTVGCCGRHADKANPGSGPESLPEDRRKHVSLALQEGN